MSELPPAAKRVRMPTPEHPLRLYNCECIPAMQQLPAESFDACITDPPYGIGFSSMQRTVNTEGFDKVLNDERPYVWWLNEAGRLLKEGGCLICFTRWDVAEAFRLAIGWAGLEVKAELVWDKDIHSMGDLQGAPGFAHEVAWFAAKGRYKFPKGGKRPTSVLRHRRCEGKGMRHPTQKPESLMQDLILQYTARGSTILEPFGGSGVTGLTAYKQGRYCFLTELDPRHYEGAVTEYEEILAQEDAGSRPPPDFSPRPDYPDEPLIAAPPAGGKKK